MRAGAGLAVLPAFLADRDPVLARVLPQEARFTRTFWMSMPAEAKHLAGYGADAVVLGEEEIANAMIANFAAGGGEGGEAGRG